MATWFRISVFLLALRLVGTSSAATFGTVVPISGSVADIALDEAHGRLYAANFGAYRVEVINTASKSLLAPITVAAPPSSVAVSPDGHYLIIGEYEKPITGPLGGFQTDTGGLTTYDLNAGVTVRHMDLPCPVLTVTFGGDGQALVVCRNPPPLQPNIFLLNPATGNLTTIGTAPIVSQDLAVPIATFPGQIIEAGASVSGDGNVITVLAQAGQTGDSGGGTSGGAQAVLVRYSVATHALSVLAFETSPPLGPRVVSSDQTGTNIMAAWGLLRFIPKPLNACGSVDANSIVCLWAQIPAATGVFNLGGHAWDRSRNLIYANSPTSSENNVLHVMDVDNLTVRARIRLQENLAGKSVLSADMNTMYAASISGVTILPIGQLASTPQVASFQEDLLFQADACSAGFITQTLALGNFGPLGAAPADFTLSIPAGTNGITFSATTATTPAAIQITVDPTVFQGARGTTVIPLTITTNSGVNLPAAVRLLINTKDVNQRGRIVNVPGKIVDTVADPARGRLYLLRQDINAVLVMDMATQQMIPAPLMRTGNTPVHMALTTDLNYLIVGNDNSQIATVLDLNSLQQTNPILFPFGHYPRAVGVVNGSMFTLIRPAGNGPVCGSTASSPPAFLDHITFAAPDYGIGDTPCTLAGAQDPAIYQNNLPTPDGVLAPAPGNNYLLLALASGAVAEYDVSAKTWTTSRSDFTALGGAYGSFNGYLAGVSGLPLRTIQYVVGPNMLDLALVQLGSAFPDNGATSSGVTLYLGVGLRTTSTAPNAPGVIQFFDPSNQNQFDMALLAESPVTASTIQYPPVGLIGESVLSFTRSLAISPDQSTIFIASISGVTVLPGNFYVPIPKPVITSVVNAADMTSGVAGGGAIDIMGAGLASNTTQASGLPWPTELAGACVTVNNLAMPLLIASPGLLLGQLPYAVTGGATLVVHAPGGVSDPFSFTARSTAPAIFHTGSEGNLTGLPAVYRDDNGQLLSFSNPVHPDTVITMYVTGLGTATPLPALGNAAVANPPSVVNSPPTMTLGGQSMTVLSAVMSPGWPTVYTVIARAPHQVQPGVSVPLTITSGSSSTTLQVRVVSP